MNRSSIAHPCVRLFAALAVFTCLSAANASAASLAPNAPVKMGEVMILDDSAAGLFVDKAPEVIADGFSWTEGPLWLASDQSLLFEDMLNNRMYRWKEGEGASVFLEKSGDTTGTCKAWNPGSNGMAQGADGWIYFCQHGDRRIVKMNPSTKELVTVVDAYNGLRLNSPNDLVFDAQGNLYFTDPPYGLVREEDSDLGFCGVYRLTPDGDLKLLNKELVRPNGIALSLDEKTLYVNDSNEKAFAVHAYQIKDDGTLSEGKLFWDAMPFAGEPGATDGMKVDERGNVWTTGPGGVFVLSPEGRLLARVKIAEPTGNLVFGGKDGRTLFIMANHSVLRLKTGVRGAVK